MSEQNEQSEQNQVEEIEAPAHTLTEEEMDQLKGGGKVSVTDFHFAPTGGSNAAGPGMGGGKVSTRDFS